MMRQSLRLTIAAVLLTIPLFPADAGIQLSSFTASGSGAGVRLDWTTLTETNNFGFRVQRSLNSETDYQTVAGSFIGGAGTTGVPQNYTYTDAGVNPGTWYYRLQQIDLSGPLHYTYGILAHRPSYGQYLPDTTTRLLLHFDETAGLVAHDLSVFRTHGAVTGAASVAGRFGPGRSFTLPSHSVQVPDTPSLHVNGQTVEAWITSSSFAAMGPGVILTKRRSSGGASYKLRMSGTSGRVCFLTGVGPGDSVVSTSVLQNGHWYHIAGVYNQSTLSLYLNGVLEAAHSLTGSVPYDGSGLFIGQDSAGTGSWLGTIDEIRVSSGARTPSEFNLLLPPVGMTASLSGSVVQLGWQSGGGGVGLLRYRVYRGTDSTALSLRDSSSQNVFQDSQAPPNMQLFYRVSAVDSTAFEGRPGQTISLRTPPAIPLLASPADGATGLLPPVILRWFTSPGASSYRVQCGTDSLFSTVIIDDSTVTDTTFSLPALAGPVRYFWRVFARGTVGSSSPSVRRRFDVLGAPGAVTLVTPDSGAVITTLQITLRWRATALVGAYWLEYAHNPLFTGAVIDSTLTDTLFVLPPMQHGEIYWWRVRARNVQGWGVFSAPRSFTVQFTVQVSLLAGWNMISLPVQTTDDSLVQVYPSTLSPYAFAFVPLVGYVLRQVLDEGTGYWAKFPAGLTQPVAGAPVRLDSIHVSAGWNMIGTISSPVDTALVGSVPAGIRISPFFGYSGSLVQVPTLDPGKAYWVKMNAPGVLVLRQTLSGVPIGRPRSR